MRMEDAYKKTLAHTRKAFRRKPDRVEPEVFEEINRLMPGKLMPYVLDQGGEHVVIAFDDPDYPMLVYKVNIPETLPALKAKISGDPEKIKKAQEQMERSIEQRRGQAAMIRQYFGEQSVPTQRFMVRDVPVSKELVESLRPEFKGKVEGIKSVPAWVVLQTKVDLPRDRTLSLNGYYPESPKSELRMFGENAAEVMETGNKVLSGGKMGGSSRDGQVRSVTDMYPELDSIARRAKRDAEFKAKLQDLAIRLIEFTEETGIPLELAGRNNMVMSKGPKGWMVKLMDVLPMGGYSMADFKLILAKLSVGGKLTPHEAGVALNVLNTIRMVNAIALIADIPERLRVIGLERITTDTWCQEFEPLFAATRT